MSKKIKNNFPTEIEVLVNETIQKRPVDYCVQNGNKLVCYPKLNQFEHIYENSSGIKVFTSSL